MSTRKTNTKQRILSVLASSVIALGFSATSITAMADTDGAAGASASPADAAAPANSTDKATATNTESDPNSVSVSIFGITDFHGHIENGAYLATALEQMRASNNNTLFVGVGDLVGASPFASSINDDEPAFDQLREMELVVSAVGNHEFDQGQDDFVGRIQDGLSPAVYVSSNLSGGSLDGNLDPYYIEEVDGKRIAFIGGIYEQLLSSVSPAGMVGIEVGDPIESINYYADLLSDGDESNGEADAVIALVHADAYSLVGLNENVDAALAGHTHLEYTLETNAGAPIIEASCYGQAFANIELTFSGTDENPELSVEAAYNPIFEIDESGESVALYEQDETVEGIYQDALESSEELGAQTLGTIADGSTFNRASDVVGDLSGNGNNRGTESTLGNLVGD